MFQSDHSPGFTPAAQLSCFNSNLPSLQQCLQRWEDAVLEATDITPSPCPAKPLWPRENESSLGMGQPHQPLPLAACRRGALRAALPSWAAGRAFSSCPAGTWSPGKGGSPRRQGAGAPMGLIPVQEQPWDLWAHPLLTPVLELTATGKARTWTPQKGGLMEFIAQSTL